MNNFWTAIKDPIFALAPMEDVTDTVFREIVMRVADPDRLNVIYTEFTNVDGMNHPVGKLRVGERLIVNDSEVAYLKKLNVKLVAQVWGKNPEIFYRVVKEISEDERFDGIDINMGCPVKNVVKNGCCSALIGVPELAKEIVLATKEATHLPVSVKTRTGLSKHTTESWMASLMETNPAAIILHGRTQKQQSDGLADWDQIALGASICKEMNPEVAFLGNGDVMSYEDGLDKVEKYGVDGVMIGRGIFQNPWFFSNNQQERTRAERIDLLLQHALLYQQTWGSGKNFNILKRFFKIYTSNFADASQLRVELMQCTSFAEVEKLVSAFGKSST
ncbi:MAG: tRNA dihydrouridine synthase [Prolixibacteraceae bacterium]